jgi:hypothetical protein
MFCPQCHAEHRPGFTHCTDCDVPLVPFLPQAKDSPSRPFPTGTLEILWEGEDLALFEDLLEGLRAASISYFDQPLGIYPGVRRRDPFPVQPMTRFGYQLAVLSSDLVRARQILGKLLDEGPQDMELPPQDEERREEPAATVLQEEGLTCEVWCGSDDRLAEFVESALKENGIAIRLGDSDNQTQIYVSAANEKRARKIVKEVVEGTPPE